MHSLLILFHPFAVYFLVFGFDICREFFVLVCPLHLLSVLQRVRCA